VAFYRDGPGLLEVGGFEDHAGYSGAFLNSLAGVSPGLHDRRRSRTAGPAPRSAHNSATIGEKCPWLGQVVAMILIG
jgi:hypothetical protein